MIQPKYLYRKNNNITNIITHMRTTLKNPYYFTKDNVIFKISDSNPSEDNCGKHYKKFDTEQKQLKKGSPYFDINCNPKIAENDGAYTVAMKTAVKTATVTANKAVFPYFDVTYTYMKNGTNTTETTTFWLDDLIEVGDKMTSGKFQNKTIHKGTTETTQTYVAYFKAQYIDNIVKDIINGVSFDLVKANNALAFVDQETMINGNKVKITQTGIEATTEDILNAIRDKVKEYGDEILKIFEKTCNVTIASE